MTTLQTRESRTPPGPPRRATFGLLRRLAGDRLALMSDAASTYGDAVRIAIGPKTLYFFNHPDHAKHVLADNSANYHKGIGYVQAKRALGDGLLTSDGALWREQRRITQPAFQHKRIAGSADLIAAEAGRLTERLAGHAGGEPVDVLDELTGLTLGVLGHALLETDLGGFTSLQQSFESVQDQAMFDVETLGAVPSWLPLPRQLRFRRARADLRRVVDRLVDDRRPGGGHDDLLSRLVSSTEAEPDPAVGRRRLHDELITLLLAGHETTASTLGWTFHLLASRPDVRRRLREEALSVLGDRPPRYDDLRRLSYTTSVLEEAMRLYPPVWILPRVALADDEVGGYHVPAGADVLVCPYTLHRHPAFWPEPGTFDPDRFGPDAPADRPRYAYLPFGAGPRFCVGSNLGMLEAAFVLATVSRELELTAVPGHRAVPEPMLSLRVRGGLPMRVTRR